jgi:hypothetical protein
LEKFEVEELTRYLLKISDVSNFEDMSRASENMIGDFRLPDENRFSH